MTRGRGVYRFVSFAFQPSKRLLCRDGQCVRLSPPQSAILELLCTRAGQLIPKETILDAGWGGLAINPNSADQVISRLRRLLGDTRTTATYIETVPQEGYRFKAPVQQARGPTREIPEARLAEQLAPFRAFIEGQMELFTLSREKVEGGRRAFEEIVRQAPDYAPAHVGLAMACALIFEATASDAHPDVASLEVAHRHVLRATALDPKSADAWSARGFVKHLTGDTDEPAAATLLAISIEPENYLHPLRGSYTTWGDYRRKFAEHVLHLCPGMALPRWLIATPYIARGAFAPAFEHLRLGCAAQDEQTKSDTLTAVGLHLLHGLTLAAHDRLDEAEAELRRELPWVESDHIWARECAANTFCTLGAIRLRQQRRQEADAAFTRALTILPQHVAALAALHGKVPTVATGATPKAVMNAALAQAIVLVRGNRHPDAARVYADAVARMPRGHLGWMLPVEPLLHPLARREHWDAALALVRDRAF